MAVCCYAWLCRARAVKSIFVRGRERRSVVRNRAKRPLAGGGNSDRLPPGYILALTVLQAHRQKQGAICGFCGVSKKGYFPSFPSR